MRYYVAAVNRVGKLMIRTIAKLDALTAAGILARAALDLENEGNPAAEAVLEGESGLRSAILREVRDQLGVRQDDDSPEAIAKIAEFLDDEADVIIGPLDEEGALRRLAESGDLPSDRETLNKMEVPGKDLLDERLHNSPSPRPAG
jgi:hypothetical protein